MNTSSIKEFFNCIQNLKDRDYFHAIIKYHICTLCNGLKPSSLIRFSSSGRNLYSMWRMYSPELYDSVFQFQEMWSGDGEILIMFYVKNHLLEVLTREENRLFLMKYGYPSSVELKEYLDILKLRITSAFPHEAGIFLGIPLKDVQGFIQNSGKNYLIEGYWKVYDNCCEALKTFELYDHVKLEAVQSITACSSISLVSSTQ